MLLVQLAAHAGKLTALAGKYYCFHGGRETVKPILRLPKLGGPETGRKVRIQALMRKKVARQIVYLL
ncbi:hypothetical protein GCM10023186_21520 [Hymenobacter koreensis]|uniref:Uncharacterized protein n=1 Tax=Hymenobacter koreensis TaxID=1084523 RepID=A0ABP8IZS1_9BACT